MPLTPPSISTLIAIRAAHHPEARRTYDRVVFEFSGPIPLLRIEYVKELIGDGSGLPVPINGRAILLVQFTPPTRMTIMDNRAHLHVSSQSYL